MTVAVLEKCDHGEQRRDREPARLVSNLALRYRSGDNAALAELHAELEDLLRAFLRPYLSPSGPLPPTIEASDLSQQAVVALAEAVLEWRPERCDNFLPYLIRSFPWRIQRYVSRQWPSGGSPHVQVFSLPHDLLIRQMAEVVGRDGRDWDGDLICGELLEALPALSGRVLGLHLFRGLSFAEVSRVLGISRSRAHEVFQRAISLLRSALTPRST